MGRLHMVGGLSNNAPRVNPSLIQPLEPIPGRGSFLRLPVPENPSGDPSRPPSQSPAHKPRDNSGSKDILPFPLLSPHLDILSKPRSPFSLQSSISVNKGWKMC